MDHEVANVISSDKFSFGAIDAIEYMVHWDNGDREPSIKLFWVRDNFSTMKIEGKPNVIVHQDFLEADFNSVEILKARDKVSKIFKEYWGIN